MRLLLLQTINVRREIINTRIQELSKMFEHISNKQASKIIKFYNLKTQQIIAQAKIPNFVKLNSRTLANLSNLSNRMKMLYIDVLHRGYYFNKPSPVNVSDIYIQQHQKHCQEIYISNNEAVYTIWRCLARQIGRPSQYSNISQDTTSIPKVIKKMKYKNLLPSQTVSNCMKQSSMICKQKKNALQKYLVNQKQLNSLQSRIISEYQRINSKQKYRIQQEIQYNCRIHKVLAQQILALELEVFVKSLVGIRRFKQNCDIIEIVLQQSYPTIKMRKNKAIQLIGQATYNQLWQKYQIYYGPNNNLIPIVCHACLAPLNNASNFQYCNNKYAIKNLPHTFLTDPYLYKDLILNENPQRQDSTKYIHPYLIYYNLNNKEQTPICNRYYCEKCIEQGFKIDDEGQCQYCVGICMCIRCKDMDILTKMMAMYIQYKGKLGELTNKFAMTFDMKNLQIESKKQVQSATIKHLQQQFQQYLQYFEDKNIFVKQNSINDMRVIKYFQQEATLEDKLNLREYQINKIRQQKQKIQQRIKIQQSKRKQKQIQQSVSQQRQEYKKKQKINLLNNKKRQEKKQQQDKEDEYQESSSF